MRGGGQATHPNRRAIHAPLALCLALLALLGQSFAQPTHRMPATPNPTEIARELRAVFGDAAALCVQADADEGSGAPRDPHQHCDDCPLCRAGAAHALLLPAPVFAPTRLYLRPAPIGPPADSVALRQPRTAFAQPRAPPLQA